MKATLFLTLTLLCLPAARADEPVPHESAARAHLPERVLATLRSAPRLELFSILSERGPDPREATFVARYPIRKQVAVEDAARRRELLGAIYEGLVGGGPVERRGDAHHGLRATHEGRTVELVISYMRRQLQVWEGSGEPLTVALSDAGEATLNRLLGQTATVTPGWPRGRPLAAWGERLKSDDPEVAEQAAEAIAQTIGYVRPQEPATAEPTPMEASVEARREAAKLFADAGEAWRSVPEYVVDAAISDPDAEVRGHATRAITGLTAGDLLDRVLERLLLVGDDYEHVTQRVRAAETIAALGPRAAKLAEQLVMIGKNPETPAPVRDALRVAVRRLRER